MYDEVVRTPMIWHWRGKIPVEAARPELVSFYDFLPSLCELTGIAPPANAGLCGRSYLPLVFNQPLPKKKPWRNLVFGHFRDTEMARDDRFKLVVRRGGEGPNEFYDLAADPRERANLYENPRYRTVRDRMAAALDAWREPTS